MQLFTIGLKKLHPDGTHVIDPATGGTIPTYTNDDIMAFARIWTGLDIQPGGSNTVVSRRSNFETYYANNDANFKDAMWMEPKWHDRFPKTKLDAGYIGDAYPLCYGAHGLPKRTWLGTGARFRLLGAESAEGEGFDVHQWVNNDVRSNARGRLSPDPASSTLYQRLCQRPAAGGDCSFPSEVTLTAPVPCDGRECDAERPRSLRVVDGSRIVFYEYIQPPCVRLALFDEGRYINVVSVKSGVYTDHRQCADPAVPLAGTTCCSGSTEKPVNGFPDKYCRYPGEMVSYATAAERCTSQSKRQCTDSYAAGYYNWWKNGCGGTTYTWLNSPCSVRVQVHDNGYVNLVEDSPTETAGGPKIHTTHEFKPNSEHAFRIRWNTATAGTSTAGAAAAHNFPRHDAGCASADASGVHACAPAAGNTCLCSVSVATGAVFTAVTGLPTSVAEVEAALFIGAAPPTAFNESSVQNGGAGRTYSLCATAECEALKSGQGISVWLASTSMGAINADTIFELSPGVHANKAAWSKPIYLLNLGSTVSVGGGFSFRNPPHFMPLLGETMDGSVTSTNSYGVGWPKSWGYNVARDMAVYEVEALIDHLFNHPNTPPFIAHRLIQRFTSSNPSPRYIKAVADAFRSGVYATTGTGGASSSASFGTGRYGDLAATVAAMLLDREARSTTLDADPGHGKLREPLVKVIHLMRAMEYTSAKGREVIFSSMDDRLGMAPFLAPSVFNFYQPDYQPAGFSEIGLVAPEAQLSTAPLQIGYLNGMSSLIDVGLVGGGVTSSPACAGAFGPMNSKPRRRCAIPDALDGKTEASADGHLRFTPSGGGSDGSEATVEEVVDELSLLLTDGRLSQHAKTVVAAEYNRTMLETGSAKKALKVAQKLVIASAEFHATNRVDGRGERPLKPPPPKSLGRPFKAIVVVFLPGGIDSHNLLVPHSGCTGVNGDSHLYDEYVAARTNVALPKNELLTIGNSGGDVQPCATMGMNPEMQFAKQLYDDGDAAWLANIGALVEPVTKAEYEAGVRRLPPDLFAHNVQQRCMHNLHAQYGAAKGVLGRATTALLEAKEGTPLAAQLFSLVGNIKMLEGGNTPTMIGKKTGIARYSDLAALAEPLANLTSQQSTSVFAETYAQSLESTLRTTEATGAMLSEATLDTEAQFDSAYENRQGETHANAIALQFKQVAKVLKIRQELGFERAAFVTDHGAFDTHTNLRTTVDQGMADFDAALKLFVGELKSMGLWGNVTIVTVSDFGRTLTSNGLGTDHAWGGNHFVMSGALKGGKILGKYPDALHADGDLNIGRGRLIPTMAWEGMWQALAQWYGVEEGQMSTLLPNLANFPPDYLISAAQLFDSS
jgi:cullin-associated NEDD8-dissociated protein 1